jgi:hypothetical protein
MPKSASFTPPVGQHHDVAGLHVAVDDADAVGGLEGPEELDPMAAVASGGERPLGGHHLGQRELVDELHDQVHAVGLVDDVEDLDRARVVDAGRRLRLAHDPRPQRVPLVVHEVGGDRHLLDGHRPAQHRVLATPDATRRPRSPAPLQR